MFYQIFFSLKVNGSAIINNKHAIYQLPHKFLSDLKVKELTNVKEIWKLVL